MTKANIAGKGVGGSNRTFMELKCYDSQLMAADVLF